MPTETSTGGLSRRLAALSPDKRALLQRLMQATAAETNSLDEIPLQPRDRRDFPLSAAQERMWFNHQWSPDQPLYSESFGLLVEGELKTDLLQQSFDLVMARHEIFTVDVPLLGGAPLSTRRERYRSPDGGIRSSQPPRIAAGKYLRNPPPGSFCAIRSGWMRDLSFVPASGSTLDFHTA